MTQSADMVFCSLPEEMFKSSLRILAETELILGEATMFVTNAESEDLANVEIDCSVLFNTAVCSEGAERSVFEALHDIIFVCEMSLRFICRILIYLGL